MAHETHEKTRKKTMVAHGAFRAFRWRCRRRHDGTSSEIQASSLADPVQNDPKNTEKHETVCECWLNMLLDVFFLFVYFVCFVG